MNDGVGQMIKQFDLKTQLPVHLDVALNEERWFRVRGNTCWMGSHMEVFEEERLFDRMPTAPVKGDELVPLGEKPSFVDECEDEGLLEELRLRPL